MSVKYQKLIAINIVVLLTLIVSPILFLQIFRKLDSFLNKKDLDIDERADYPVYKNKKISHELFNKKNVIPTEYRSFVGWERQPVNYKLINISSKYNNRVSSGERLENSVWFFGGSTVWGTGVRDSNTIPSLYYKKTKKNVFNFGETSWNSRQSLNKYLNVLGDGNMPDKVIFYEGVNDVYSGCRIENKIFPAHSREGELIQIIQNQGTLDKVKSVLNSVSKKILEPYQFLIKSSNLKKNSQINGFDCHLNEAKSKSIATHMVSNWYTAYLVSKANGIQFSAILQPQIFTSITNFDYFSKTEKEMIPTYRTQYELVYPLILKEIEKKCFFDKGFCNSFIDGSLWIKDGSQVFIDFCHLTYEGNQIIVNNIIENN